MNRNILTFIGCDSEYDDAQAVIFGAPFDSTTSYRPGARFASKAIRNESYGLEVYSPYQDKSLDDYKIFDGGDLELCFGNPARVLDDIEKYVLDILRDGKLPVMIGGEHLVTLAGVRAVRQKHHDLHIIHLDAHTDLRNDYMGETLSHATVIRRCWELVGDEKIFQFGIRSGEKNEYEWAKDHTYLQQFNLDGLDSVIGELKGKPVYLTIDLDVLDPSIFPATGTPEAGGIDFITLLNAIISMSKLNIVGCDITELSPPYDQSGASTAVACKVFRELLLAILR